MATAAAAMALGVLAPAAHAAQSDPAAAQIETWDGQLIDLMKEAKSLGVQGRFHKLEPIVTHTFDIPTMVRFAVGPTWAQMTPAQQAGLTTAFARLTAASFAHNFSGYSGQSFQINPSIVTRGTDKVVQTTLVQPHDTNIAIAYRMRQSGGGWKVLDVIYSGISQLTTRRADFQAPLQQGGANALIAHLNALVDKELK
jgi:phospholipid transport system substrate-binding protein